MQMTETDPFNFQFPRRDQTMYLQTISQQDVGLKKIRVAKDENYSLKTNDIAGAQSILPGYRFSNKETYVNKLDDIDRSGPKRLIKEEITRVSNILKNEDIKGAKPQINKFHTTRTSTNPLTPEYKLPYAEIKIASPPKFIRDTINIDDIEGTKPNPYNFYKFKKNYVLEEIEGSKPKKLFVPKDQINILDVRDINEYLQFKSQRVTNPLNPIYVVHDENNQKMEIGEIEQNKSRRLHPIQAKKECSLDLRTTDINGAFAGSVSDKFLRKSERKDIKETMKVLDIPGAQVNTLKKGITTNRVVNPIWPFNNYQYLGVKEDLEGKHSENKSNNPLVRRNVHKFEKEAPVLNNPILNNPILNKENNEKKSINANEGDVKSSSTVLANSATKNILPQNTTNVNNSKRSSQASKASNNDNSSKNKTISKAQQLDHFILK